MTALQELLAAAPEERRPILREVHGVIRRAAPKLPMKVWRQKLWGGTDQTILGYGNFSYRSSSGKDVEWFLIGLANQKDYVSVYVNAVRDRKYLPEVYGSRLGKVKIGKSSVSFGRLEDLELGALEGMLTEALVG
ncbi:MAG TPA: hypothetical protein VMR89_04310 [Actinomycetota bacterium]|nr:hypothetical protein [Actinomycetota bacterium]